MSYISFWDDLDDQLHVCKNWQTDIHLYYYVKDMNPILQNKIKEDTMKRVTYGQQKLWLWIFFNLETYWLALKPM